MAELGYEAFVKFLDKEWPLWRQHSDTALVHKLKRAFLAGMAAAETNVPAKRQAMGDKP